MTAVTYSEFTSHASLSTIENEVLRQLRSLRFGQLTVQIHEARIVQIERTEKIRPDSSAR